MQARRVLGPLAALLAGGLILAALVGFEADAETAKCDPSATCSTLFVANDANAATSNATLIRGRVDPTTFRLEVETQAAPEPVTYEAAALVTPSAVATTDVCTLEGGATTARVRRVRVGFRSSGASAQAVPVALIMRSAANTGGTSTSLTAVRHDQGDAAATATARTYTVNPAALGATVGTMQAEDVSAPPITVQLQTPLVEWTPGVEFGAGPIELDSGETLSVNLVGAVANTLTLSCHFTWTE